MPSDTGRESHAPALKAATQPTAMAGLFGDRPASTPPPTPMTTRLASIDPSRRPITIQVIQAAAQTASMTAIPVSRALPKPGAGRATDTVTITMTRPTTCTVWMTRATPRERAPGGGDIRVAREGTGTCS